MKSLTALATAGLMLASTTAARPAAAADYEIGVIASLTGAAAFLGQPSVDGMKFAVDELNAAQALGPGNRIVLNVADDATDKAQSLSIANRLMANPNLLAIVGPSTTTTSVPVAKLANEKQVPTWTGTNFAGILEAGPWSFTLTEPPTVAIPNLTNYVATKLKVKNCTVVSIQDNELYVILSKLFSESMKEKGIPTLDYIGIKMTDTNFSGISVKVVAQRPDCVFVSAPAETAANVMTQLRQAGLDPATTFIGHNGMASNSLIRTGGEAVEGLYLYAAWVPGGTTEFGRRFAAAFEKSRGFAPNNWEAVGYSIMTVLAQCLKAAGPNPTRDAVRLALTNVKDAPVVIGGGTYSRDETRAAHYKETIMQVRGGKFVPAP